MVIGLRISLSSTFSGSTWFSEGFSEPWTALHNQHRVVLTEQTLVHKSAEKAWEYWVSKSKSRVLGTIFMAVNDTKVCDPLYKLFGGAVAAASPAGDLTSASKKKTPGVAERTVAGAFLPIFHFRFSKELLSTLKIISSKTDLGTFAFLLVLGPAGLAHFARLFFEFFEYLDQFNENLHAMHIT